MHAGLEISDLARAAGISRQYLSHLETGYRDRMRPGRYAALRTALGLQPDDTQLLRSAPPHEDT